MSDPLIDKYEVDASNQKVESNDRTGPKFHLTHSADMRPIPLIHADSMQVSVDVQRDSTTKELQRAFVSIQLLSGDAGLYIAVNPETCERIGQDLIENAALLRKTLETGENVGGNENYVEVETPEDPRDLL